jgi:hypothetical protein
MQKRCRKGKEVKGGGRKKRRKEEEGRIEK